MNRHDRVSIALDAVQSVREKSPEGHLRITRCVLSSACVCPYFGREIPGWEALGLNPDETYQLYRDPTALAQAAASMDGKPVLFQHKPVSAEEHPREITVGAVGATQWENPDLIGTFTIWDQEAIDAIESGGLKAVSAGYAYRAIAQGGVHDGQPYSLTMVDIVFNHLALVAAPRVPHAIIGDENTTMEAALATNKPAQKKALRAKLLASVRPFLAQDADTTKLEQVLDDLEEAQTLAGDPDGQTDATDGVDDALRELLKGRVPEDVVEQVVALAKGAAEKPALATDDTPEEMAARLKEAGFTDEQIALCCAAMAAPGEDGGPGSGRPGSTEGGGEPSARSLPTPDDGRGTGAMDRGISKTALDAVMASTIQRAERAAVQRIGALHEAREAVKPYVGDVHGMDSAAAVYGFALKEAGYDVRGLDERTLGQLWKNHAAMTDAAKQPAVRIAQDSGEVAKFRDEYGLSRINVKA